MTEIYVVIACNIFGAIVISIVFYSEIKRLRKKRKSHKELKKKNTSTIKCETKARKYRSLKCVYCHSLNVKLNFEQYFECLDCGKEFL